MQQEDNQQFRPLEKLDLDQDFPQRKKNYHPWTLKEEKLLNEGVQIFGKKWDKIQQAMLPNLTPTQLKNKYYAMQRLGADSRSDSRSVSQVETSSKSAQHQPIERKQDKPNKKDEQAQQNDDEWLNYNFMDDLDLLNFEEFTR